MQENRAEPNSNEHDSGHDISPIELFKNQDYEAAAMLLKSRISSVASEKDSSLLAECYFRLKKYSEARETIENIESKDSYLLEIAGICSLEQEEYEAAKEFFTKAIEAEEHPNTYYLFAVAEQGPQSDYQLTAESKDKIRELLGRATGLPSCPLQPFLWLESLQGYEATDIENRAAILKSAVKLYPTSEEPRIRLARWLTNRLGSPQEALRVLQPLLEQPTSNTDVWMQAFYAAQAVNDYSSALDYLERTDVQDARSQISISLLKADANLALKHFDKALTLYGYVAGSNDLEMQVVGLFGRARAQLELQLENDALESAKQATALFLNNDIYLTAYDPLAIENELYGYSFDEHIKNIGINYVSACGYVNLDNAEFIGGLCCLLYEIASDGAGDLTPHEEDLVVRAHELCSHPRFSRCLADWLARQKKWASAVRHHFEYCLWALRHGFRLLTDTNLLNENASVIRKSERTTITKIAVKYFNNLRTDQEAITKVFEPFYQYFWRDLLLKDEASTILVQISSALIDCDSADNDVLWDYAFHLARIGKTDDAIRAYQQVLKVQASNAAALHNLSILLELKGQFAEAVDLSARAASLAPEDDLIVRRHNQLKAKSRSVQIEKRKKQGTRKVTAPDHDEMASSSPRKGLSKKLRFEVFKRDSFTCQYCGRKSPDVVLEADHIDPSSKGGSNDILNLITSCKDCNSGKSDRRLSDNTVLEKQRKQLEDLQERKEQIEMMFQWQRELKDLDAHTTDQLADLWDELVNPFCLNQNGKATLKKLLGRFQIDEIMEAMRVAVAQYVEYEGDTPAKESVEKAWGKIGGICRVKKLEEEKPYMRDLYYIRGILRNRLSYTKEWVVLGMLEDGLSKGATIDELRRVALEARNWTTWVEMMDAIPDHSSS